MAATAYNSSVVPITRGEIVDRLAWAAKSCGLALDDMLDQYYTVGLEDPGAVTDVLILLDLLPPGDPLVSRHVDDQHREHPR
ncbi:hypothetical protein [Embleya sp. NPDC005971]|uniref:hypothetical protein n=1 Tax=Embleya sp. NPDC005971 TaxID=3156724 RepID=UPI0033FAC14F